MISLSLFRSTPQLMFTRVIRRSTVTRSREKRKLTVIRIAFRDNSSSSRWMIAIIQRKVMVMGKSYMRTMIKKKIGSIRMAQARLIARLNQLRLTNH